MRIALASLAAAMLVSTTLTSASAAFDASPTTQSVPTAPENVAGAAAGVDATAVAQPSRITAYVTGYTYYDNTPPGTATISHPVLHSRAGGTGTYANPITIAVGHRFVGQRDVLDYPKGTRMYMYYLDRYFIVEDTCGDGPHPERGACHVHPRGTSAWLDIWMDGRGTGASSSTNCAERITGNHTVLINPPRNHRVVPGAVARRGNCAV